MQMYNHKLNHEMSNPVVHALSFSQTCTQTCTNLVIFGGFQRVKIGITKVWIKDFLLYVTNISIAWWITLLLQGLIRSPFSLLLLCLR